MSIDAILSLPRGLIKFIDDMGTTPREIKIWASLFPFPQLIVGGYLSVTRGFDSPAGWYFVGRAVSFVVAGQVSIRKPFTKMCGPIMHIPFLWVAPMSISWLLSGSDGNDVNMTRFITYTTAITSISLVMDLKTAYIWFTGGQPGYMPSMPKGQEFTPAILPVPSMVMGLIGWLV